MNRKHLTAIAFAAATFTAGQAVAAGPSGAPTRQQVQAELAEAIRTGDVFIGGETNLKAREAFPGSYPARPVARGVSREQVRADLAEAIRTGNLFVGGETNLMANGTDAATYSVRAGAGPSREQVKADLAEAIRTGDILVGGETNLKAREAFPGAYPVQTADQGDARVQVQAEPAAAL